MMHLARYASLMIAILVLSSRGVAQESFYEENPQIFTGGLILGGNFSQVDGDSYSGYHKVGLNAGAMVYVHFTPSFGVSMELIYSEKGSRGVNVTESLYFGTYVEKYYMDLNYVEVPVLVHYKSHRIDFEAGVSYGYLIHSNEFVEADYPVIINPDYNYFKTTDLNYLIGGTIKVYKNLYLNARYQYSILSIRDEYRVPVGFSYGSAGQFNNLFAVRLVYVLQKKRDF